MSLRWSSATDQLYAVSNSSPSLDLDFASNKSLLDNISGNNLVTFRRASTGTYVDSDGLIKTSPVNLLYNTTTYSNWINSGQSIQTNAAISPSGLNDAVKLVADASAGGKLFYRSVTTTATNVCSVYAKAGEYTNIQLRELSAARFYVNFDLSAGTYAVPQSGSAPAGGFDFISADIQDVGNGWYRCIVVNSRVGGIAFSIAGYPDSATVTTSNPNFTGDGTSGVYIWGAQVEEGSTATTYIPTTTTIGGAPRFDHDPVTGESLGLLIEESRTNDAFYSNDFTQWVTTATGGVNPAPVLVPASGVSPSGLTDATEITYPAVSVANSWSIIYLRPGTSGNTQYVFSAYLKGTVGGETIYLMSSPDGVSWASQSFTLTTDWERCVFPHTTLGINSYFQIGVDLRDGAQSGQPAQVISVWGAQVEEGSFPTSYIPTTGTIVTRAADVASITGTNFSSWYNQSEGTVFVDRTFNANFGHAYYFTDSGLTGNRVRLQANTHSGDNLDGSAFNLADIGNKTALGLQTNNISASANGGTVVSDTSYTMPSTFDRLFIGNHPTVPSHLNGHIARLAYYPYRLSDTILQEITS
jgi:hypothetical protein